MRGDYMRSARCNVGAAFSPPSCVWMYPRPPTVRPNFFLPDGDVALQLVDEELTRLERLRPVRRRDCNDHARLPQSDTTGSVQQRELDDRPPLAGPARQLVELSHGHLPIRLVIQ